MEACVDQDPHARHEGKGLRPAGSIVAKQAFREGRKVRPSTHSLKQGRKAKRQSESATRIGPTPSLRTRSAVIARISVRNFPTVSALLQVADGTRSEDSHSEACHNREADLGPLGLPLRGRIVGSGYRDP